MKRKMPASVDYREELSKTVTEIEAGDWAFLSSNKDMKGNSL